MWLDLVAPFIPSKDEMEAVQIEARLGIDSTGIDRLNPMFGYQLESVEI